MILFDLYLLFELFMSPFIAAANERERAELMVLKESFQKRIPDGWLFYDGEGRN